MKHLIQRQVLDVRLMNIQKAKEQQEAIRQLYWNRIVPALDQVFSKMVPEDVTLRIDQLKLDIGIVEKDHLVAEITKQINGQLKDIVFQARQKQKADAKSSSKAPSKNLDSKLISHKDSKYKALVFFLENGLFPWWFKPEKDFSLDTLIEKVIVEKPKEIIHFLEHRSESSIQKRLIGQFSELQLFDLVKITDSHSSEILCQTLEACAEIDATKITNKKSWQKALLISVKKAAIFILTKPQTKSILPKEWGRIIIAEISKQLQKPINEIRFFYQKRNQEKICF